MAGAAWADTAQEDKVTETVQSGPEVIRAFVKTLPPSPGVYRMLDEAGEVVYVGKARNLKARVTNYTRPDGLDVRLQKMIAATHSMEFVRTETTVRQGLMNATDVLENWVNDYLYMRETTDWGVLTYTCHPFIIGRGHRMIMLEKLLRACMENGAVFMAMEDAVAEFRQGRA